ncbi:MAG: prepilin-type N-terminal cleavage/methylation domain-containing protein [Aerococcus sp.]|nr:prepilin-type N-terminal cleavage/methylation domain-containing protein [Aerococcus sp.]
MRKANHWHRGFTLIQMLLVLGIVSLLMTATTMEVERAKNRIALQTTVDTVMQEYEHVRKQAMVEGESYLLYFYKQRVIYYCRSIDPNSKVFEYEFPTGVSAYPNRYLHIRGGSGYLEPMTVTFTGADHAQIQLSFQLGGEYEGHWL